MLFGEFPVLIVQLPPYKLDGYLASGYFCLIRVTELLIENVLKGNNAWPMTGKVFIA